MEWKPLGEVVNIKRGKRLVRSELEKAGEYAVYQNSLQPLGYYHQANCPSNSTFIITAGAAGEIGYSYTDFWAADDCYYLECPKDKLNDRFVFHALMNQKQKIVGQVRKASVPRLGRNSIENISIPIPPLSVQTKIVQILDAFTAITAELTAELAAELDMRNKQYQYYRDKLLSENELAKVGFEWKSLGEVCLKVSSGGTPLSTREEYYNGDIPWLRTQEVKFNEIFETEVKITQAGLDNSSAKWIPANCVIAAISGATAGRSAINKIPLTTNQHCCNLQINPEIALYKYVYYWVLKEFENIKSLGQGARSDLNSGIIKNYQIPIPPLAEQARIVAILDKFDTLTQSISDGLPREIELRQQQYEYYREMLLGFERDRTYTKTTEGERNCSRK